MKILITGSKGFIAKNLAVRLKELKKNEILSFHRGMNQSELGALIQQADFIFHLAGVNRPQNETEFQVGNSDLTEQLVSLVEKSGRDIPVVFSSSIQADNESPYGKSKKQAEKSVEGLKNRKGYVYRLPNVFGKWSRPNYNSAVATFCYNAVNGIESKINDPNAMIKLVYVDDVVENFVNLLKLHEENKLPLSSRQEVAPIYSITVGQLSEQINAFKASQKNLITEDVGHGLLRALHATYISFFSADQFSYVIPKYEDPRGVFVEMLKTKSAGQFSYFTAHPGITRGGHYHHTKTEKFLVIKGRARYKFRNILTGETYELIVDSKDAPKVVETIPGWAHDITNIGTDEMIVMLWANEIFDRQKPDTIGHEV